jgi:hypothetical protein
VRLNWLPRLAPAKLVDAQRKHKAFERGVCGRV